MLSKTIYYLNALFFFNNFRIIVIQFFINLWIPLKRKIQSTFWTNIDTCCTSNTLGGMHSATIARIISYSNIHRTSLIARFTIDASFFTNFNLQQREAASKFLKHWYRTYIFAKCPIVL